MSIRQLAICLSVSRATVGHWETRTHTPSVAALIKVAEVTGVDLEWLLTGKGRATSPFLELEGEEIRQVEGGIATYPSIYATPESGDVLVHLFAH